MSPWSPNLIFCFRFSQTWSETKPLQILVESFASIRLLCLLPLLRGRFSVLAPPAPALISFSLAKVQLSLTLTLSHLPCEQMALLLLFLTETALVSLPTAFSVALRPPFPFRQAQRAQVFLLKPAPFCKLSTGPGLTNKSAISLRLSLCSCHSVLSPVVPFTSNFLAGTVFSLGSLTSYNGSPDTRFSRKTTRLLSWPDGERCFWPLQSFVVFLLLRFVFFLFSDWRRAVSSKFFDTQVPSVSTEKLVLPCHARCVLSGLCSNGHSLLLSSYLTRILHAAHAAVRPRTPVMSFCTVQLRILCAAHSLATLCLCTTSGLGRGSCPTSGFDGLLPCPIFSKGSGNNNNSNIILPGYFSYTLPLETYVGLRPIV